ncbi:MAG: VanZ family protein [bacterium]
MKKALTLAASVIMTIIIFGMSGASGEESASLSVQVANIVADILDFIAPENTIAFADLHALVRKGAHVLEYALLGIAYASAFRAWELPFWPVFFLGIGIALLDEASQALALDRGPSFMDALLYDAPGYLMGAGVIGLIQNKKRQKNNVS